jgi:oligoendopeptidase F
MTAENVPQSVYRTLVDVTNANLATLHRYLALRGRMLGISDLAYYDLYTPLVTTDLTFPIDQGKTLVLKSVAPLGEGYVATVKDGFENRWMDVFPREGKRSGAYSAGSAYGVHPFVLMNYNDNYDAVTTLAHEWGHAMHSHLANEAQPLATADYGIFVAEVASTFNEALLLEQMLADASSDTERLFYLGSALETLRGTFFRQTMFAEFELTVHELAEKREALTGARFSEIYLELVRRYMGHDKGVVTVDDAYAVEWAYIPHFYYNFYVYKYATSIAASSLFAKQVLDKETGAKERFLSVLKAGGSEYAYTLLKDAGVDLATPAPYEALMAQMNSIMDEIEAILSK